MLRLRMLGKPSDLVRKIPQIILYIFSAQFFQLWDDMHLERRLCNFQHVFYLRIEFEKTIRSLRNESLLFFVIFLVGDFQDAMQFIFIFTVMPLILTSKAVQFTRASTGPSTYTEPTM